MGVLALLVIAALVVGAVLLGGLLGRSAEAGPAAPTTAPAAEPGPDPSTAPPTTAAPTTPAPTPVPSTAPPSTAAPTASSAATAQPSSTPGDTCGPSAVTLRAETDRESYAPGETPVLYLLVSNESDTPCTVNVGTSQMEFVLTLDDERVFSSTDCQDGSQDLEMTIEPGGEERATFEWARNRTVPGCEAVGEEAAEGTYSLVTRLGARSSDPVTFTLS